MRWKIRKPYAKRRALHFWHLWFAWHPVRVPTRGRGAGQTLVWLAYVCRKGKLRYTVFNSSRTWWNWEFKDANKGVDE
jgi:hypothetical protein